MKVSPKPSRKALFGFLPLTLLLVGQFGFRMADTIVQASAEVAPLEHWEKAQWQDAHFLSPRGWNQVSTNDGQLTLLPDNSADSDKTQITVGYVQDEDFGMRSTMERYIHQDIGTKKVVSYSHLREVRLGQDYDGLMQRVTTTNERGEQAYNWYFMMHVGGQKRVVQFTAESPEQQARYQKDFNRFLNNLSFDDMPTRQQPVVNPADYEGRQIATGDDPSHG